MEAKHTPGPKYAFDALADYRQLREEIGELEERADHGCECDGFNFRTCALCEDAQQKHHESRRLMDLWGDSWAMLLNDALELLQIYVDRCPMCSAGMECQENFCYNARKLIRKAKGE